jgi:hypothetical protein
VRKRGEPGIDAEAGGAVASQRASAWCPRRVSSRRCRASRQALQQLQRAAKCRLLMVLAVMARLLVILPGPKAFRGRVSL